jgi:bacteriorhodopsin
MRRIPRSGVVFYARYIDRLLTTLLLLYDLATLAGAIAPARTLCYYT